MEAVAAATFAAAATSASASVGPSNFRVTSAELLLLLLHLRVDTSA